MLAEAVEDLKGAVLSVLSCILSCVSFCTQQYAQPAMATLNDTANMCLACCTFCHNVNTMI